VPSKLLSFETLHKGLAIRFLGSDYVTAQSIAVVRLPQAGSGGFFLSGGKIVFILYIMKIGQGSGSSERMGGYDPFIFLLCFVFQSVHVAVVYLYCCAYYPGYVSYVLPCLFCFYLIYVSVVRSISCLLVSLVKLKRFICCFLYVSVVVQSCRLIYCFSYILVILFPRLTRSLLFIAILRYMSCLVIIFHILCFYIFNNHMF